MSFKKLPVAINIFPTLDYVELIAYDEKTGEIEKMASLPCQFDQASRQMADKEQMAQTIRDLFSMNRVLPNTPAVLVLPSFFTREIELPTEFSKEELRFALVSEAERFYIFKKVEPQIDWMNLDESRLLYSAFPKSEIEKYQQIFQELRIPLLAIELNYFSILRGLASTGAVAEEMETQSRWCLLVVSDNSFFASLQDGMKIHKTTDAPLSVTAEDDQTPLNEIQQDFDSFIETETFTKLIVVNNASTISSEVLLSRLSFQGQMILIEQNALTLRSRGSSEGQFPCSLEAIGGVFYTHLPELPKMNFLSEGSEDVVGIMHYKKTAFKWMVIANAAVFFLSMVLWGVMSFLIWQKDQEREQLGVKASNVGVAASAEQLVEVSRKKFIKKVLAQDVKVNNFMVGLGRLTKDDVWLEKVSVDAENMDQPLTISLEGKTLTLEQVNELSSALNGLLPNGNLEVSNAAPVTSEDGQAYFTWVIQNKAADAAAASAPPAGGALPVGGNPAMGGG